MGSPRTRLHHSQKLNGLATNPRLLVPLPISAARGPIGTLDSVLNSHGPHEPNTPTVGSPRTRLHHSQKPNGLPTSIRVSRFAAFSPSAGFRHGPRVAESGTIDGCLGDQPRDRAYSFAAHIVKSPRSRRSCSEPRRNFQMRDSSKRGRFRSDLDDRWCTRLARSVAFYNTLDRVRPQIHHNAVSPPRKARAPNDGIDLQFNVRRLRFG